MTNHCTGCGKFIAHHVDRCVECEGGESSRPRRSRGGWDADDVVDLDLKSDLAALEEVEERTTRKLMDLLAAEDADFERMRQTLAAGGL